jgi:hypothetical protein
MEIIKGIFNVISNIVVYGFGFIALLLVLYIIFMLTPMGDKMARRIKPTDDPCGNPNINKKPWDYM